MIAAETAFADGDPWLDALLGQLDHNPTIGAAAGRDRWSPPQATYLGWLDCAGLDLAPDPAKFFLREAKVALGTGSDSTRGA